MRYRYEASPLTIVLLHLVQAVLIDGQSSEEYTTAVRNVTKRPYKPVEEFKGRHFLDQMAEELTFQHKHVIVKRAAAMKRKHKDQEVTKKRLPRTTRVKTSKIWTIRTTSSTTIRPLKYNDSLRKCHRRKLMNIAVGNDKIKFEEWISREEDRKIYHEVMKPWNVIGGPKSPQRKIRKRLNRQNKLNVSQVLISTHLGFNYTMSLLQFKQQKPSYLVNWNVSHFQIYNTSIDTKGLHQGRLSLLETAKNPNLTLFDLWWNDTERNLDTQIRTISLNRSHIYRVKYPRRQDRGHRPTYLEKKKARLDLLKYYIGTTPGEIVPTRYFPRELIKNRQTPIKKLSRKVMAQQKKDRLKRINRERRRRKKLQRMGFKITNIPTPSSTKKMTKIRRQDPLLRANLSFFDRDLEHAAFYDISKMLGSEFEEVYDVIEVSTRSGIHRKQKTSPTTEFYDINEPTTVKTSVTMKRSKQKLGLEKKILAERD
ncbi:hypothetical protein M8J77_026061 [Diaphorina citri]|nr:hypothetical protein M8J77_026061 [Diaphorina citri]